MPETDESNATAPRRGILGSEALRTMAALVIVVAGLKLGADFLVPMLLAAFFAMALFPVASRLRRAGAPAEVAIAATFFIAITLVVGIGLLIGDSLSDLQEALPRYEERVDEMTGDASGWLRDKGVPVPSDSSEVGIDPQRLLSFASNLLAGFGSALSNMVVVLMVLLFLLFEADAMPQRLARREAVFGAALTRTGRITKSVTDYLSVKTLISAITGLAWGVVLALIGVDFPVLWGLLAFLLNFVPNVGSVIAAAPPILLAVVQLGFGPAAMAAGGSFVINVVLGNVIEPKLMGARLGLSVLTVFVGLIFWSWMFGAIGTLLSVPLTMVVKMALEATDDYKDMALLMGPESEPDPAS